MKPNLSPDRYSDRPCYGEVIAVLLAGLVHVVIEVSTSDLLARWYNVGVSFAFLLYLAWRVRRTAGVLRVWGLRRDNFVPALRAQVWFMAAGVLALTVFAVLSHSPALPNSFWFTLALYPIWGVAQQFALQNMIARNLTGLISSPHGLAIGSATLFAASHYPKLDLVALTFVAGTVFTLIYRKHPNLWAVGIAHGLLGSLAVYLVLHEDPGASLLGYIIGQ